MIETIPRPVLLASDHPASVTHAYASMKLLVQRGADPNLPTLAGTTPLMAAAAPMPA